MEPIDVWLLFSPGEEDAEVEAEAEANTYRVGNIFRVDWYLSAVGMVRSCWFPSYPQACAWLEGQGFEDFTS